MSTAWTTPRPWTCTAPRTSRVAGESISQVSPHVLGDGGPATDVYLTVADIAADAGGNIYIADLAHGRVRKVDSSGTITSVAGGGTSFDDGVAATDADLWPTAVRLDSAGNVLIADPRSQRIRQLEQDGTITTVAGTGERGPLGDGGPAAQAQLDFGSKGREQPGVLAVGPAEEIFLSEPGVPRIRRIDAFGTITTVLESDQTPPVVGGLAVTPGGDLLVSDTAGDPVLLVESVAVTAPAPAATVQRPSMS